MTLAVLALANRLHETLPIFCIDDRDRAVFYTPGYAFAASPAIAADIQRALGDPTLSFRSGAERLARQLEGRGRVAVEEWRALGERTFEPECLTLYLSNRCNLGCHYCYASPIDDGRAGKRLMLHSAADDADFPILSESVTYAAARLVARNCARKGKPLTLVLHGGGEPTLHWHLLQRVRTEVDAIARRQGIGVWAYIATHGVLAEDRVRWLAANFDVIGLSSDGPPEIQNANRPTAAGAPSAAIVERTARILAEAGTSYTVRATITRADMKRQRDIVSYACGRLQARSVRFEPAYAGRKRSDVAFGPEDAAEFVDQFLQARDTARRFGCELRISGVRLDEIHGPYCNPLREVLQLTPDGVATACFLSTGDGHADDGVMALGRVDPMTGEFAIDQERAQALRRRAARVPARCEPCVNVYHCARDCPDTCVITAGAAEQVHEGFRCRVQQLLGHHEIREMASQPGDIYE